MRHALTVSAFILSAASAFAAAPETATIHEYPQWIPSPGGEVTIPDADANRAHTEWRYAAARRAGDSIYVSGVIVNRRPNEGTDVAAFKVSTRRALNRLKTILEAAGSDWQHVTMINSFHVWQGPNFSGSRDEQFQAFEDVIGEFMKPPYPAWTAVGTTGLLSDGGIVEVQLIATPKEKKK
jgi:enamine deaminase RidA (YjgF/YER057c/UK114 family)